MKKRYLFIIIVSVVAIINAAYLSHLAYQYMLSAASNATSFCDLSGSVSCSSVLQSPYSKVFGIPFPMIALGVYPIILILAFLGMRKNQYGFAKAIAWISAGGMLFNFFIMYREIFLIKAFCILCFICTLIIISIFFVSSSITRRQKQSSVLN